MSYPLPPPKNALGMDTGDAKRDQDEFAKSSLSLLECRSSSGQQGAAPKELPSIVMEAAEEKFLHDLIEGNPDTAGGRIASWMFGTRCARSLTMPVALLSMPHEHLMLLCVR